MKEHNYEMVIGLEVHVELKTKTKIFCACPTTFGAAPNTQCCPVCTGMPGALPVLNEQAVRYAVKAGLATNCQIASFSKMDRKNYFYPDLPKAYQISQYDLPLCSSGFLDIELEDGESKRIGITRIHLEEDAGKLAHVAGKGTLIDCNRCGVPLIEIVSEPDLRSAAQAKAYLQKLRAIILFTGISDCRMNEGSLRCDVNLSVRKKGAEALGTRTEIKNLNSFQFVAKAIEFEFARQVRAVESGEDIVQETRRFDRATGETSGMRRKEDANDYRYFPDPDLTPLTISSALIEELASEIPPLPDIRKKMYMKNFGLTAYAAEQLCATRETADYFEAAAAATDYPKLAAHLILGELFRLSTTEDFKSPIAPCHIGRIAQMLGESKINSATGREVVQALCKSDQDPDDYVRDNGLRMMTDTNTLISFAREVIAEQHKTAADYRGGKKAALQALVGQTMKKTGGTGDPVKIRETLLQLLEAR